MSARPRRRAACHTHTIQMMMVMMVYVCCRQCRGIGEMEGRGDDCLQSRRSITHNIPTYRRCCRFNTMLSVTRPSLALSLIIYVFKLYSSVVRVYVGYENASVLLCQKGIVRRRAAIPTLSVYFRFGDFGLLSNQAAWVFDEFGRTQGILSSNRLAQSERHTTIASKSNTIKADTHTHAITPLHSSSLLVNQLFLTTPIAHISYPCYLAYQSTESSWSLHRCCVSAVGCVCIDSIDVLSFQLFLLLLHPCISSSIESTLPTHTTPVSTHTQKRKKQKTGSLTLRDTHDWYDAMALSSQLIELQLVVARRHGRQQRRRHCVVLCCSV